MQKPHGLEVGFSDIILTPVKTNENLVEWSEEIKEESISKLEAMIDIENKKTGEKISIPMRSFLTTFINSLQGLLSGDGGTDTIKAGVDVDAGASIATKLGMLIGHGTTPVVLSDSGLQTPATHASIAHGDTTLVPPYTGGAISQRKVSFALRRLFTNNKVTSIIIGEVIIKNRRVSASIASNVAGTTIARDLVNVIYATSATSVGDQAEEALGGGIVLPYDSAIQMEFKFNAYQANNGAGGAVLNLARLIYNLMFAGNQNSSPLVNTSNTAMTIGYATGATCGATGVWTVDAESEETNYGILLGYYNEERDNPPIEADETTFNVVTSGLVYGAVTVSAVTNPATGIAKFTVSRDITNTGQNTIYLDRAGLKIKDGAFIIVNRLNNNTYLNLAPNQVARLTYSLQIKV